MIPAMETPPKEPGRETRIVDIKGRNIVVRQLRDAQLLLLARDARLAQREDTPSPARMASVARMFDVLESAVADQGDKDYLLDLTVKGDLELADIMGFVTVFADETEKPKVRRGRPPSKRT